MRFLKRCTWCAWAFLLGVCAAAELAQEKKGEYLTKDGQLAQTLEVSTAQGGFAGFTGPLWVIEPSGKWRSGFSVNGQMKREERKGELTKEQLAELAQALAKYDLLGLPKEAGKPTTNHFVATIKFGKTMQLMQPAGVTLPKVDPSKANLAVPERYSGIVEAVKRVTAPRKE
jgi:hypothetical protein